MGRLGVLTAIQRPLLCIVFLGPRRGPAWWALVKHVINNTAVCSRPTERDPSAGSALRGTGLICENSKCWPGPTGQQQTPQEPSWGSSGGWVFGFVSQVWAFEPVPDSLAEIWATL